MKCIYYTTWYGCRTSALMITRIVVVVVIVTSIAIITIVFCFFCLVGTCYFFLVQSVSRILIVNTWNQIQCVQIYVYIRMQCQHARHLTKSPNDSEKYDVWTILNRREREYLTHTNLLLEGKIEMERKRAMQLHNKTCICAHDCSIFIYSVRVTKNRNEISKTNV